MGARQLAGRGVDREIQEEIATASTEFARLISTQSQEYCASVALTSLLRAGCWEQEENED